MLSYTFTFICLGVIGFFLIYQIPFMIHTLILTICKRLSPTISNASYKPTGIFSASYIAADIHPLLNADLVIRVTIKDIRVSFSMISFQLKFMVGATHIEVHSRSPFYRDGIPFVDSIPQPTMKYIPNLSIPLVIFLKILMKIIYFEVDSIVAKLHLQTNDSSIKAMNMIAPSLIVVPPSSEKKEEQSAAYNYMSRALRQSRALQLHLRLGRIVISNNVNSNVASLNNPYNSRSADSNKTKAKNIHVDQSSLKKNTKHSAHHKHPADDEEEEFETNDVLSSNGADVGSLSAEISNCSLKIGFSHLSTCSILGEKYFTTFTSPQGSKTNPANLNVLHQSNPKTPPNNLNTDPVSKDKFNILPIIWETSLLEVPFVGALFSYQVDALNGLFLPQSLSATVSPSPSHVNISSSTSNSNSSLPSIKLFFSFNVAAEIAAILYQISAEISESTIHTTAFFPKKANQKASKNLTPSPQRTSRTAPSSKSFSSSGRPLRFSVAISLSHSLVATISESSQRSVLSIVANSTSLNVVAHPDGSADLNVSILGGVDIFSRYKIAQSAPHKSTASTSAFPKKEANNPSIWTSERNKTIQELLSSEKFFTFEHPATNFVYDWELYVGDSEEVNDIMCLSAIRQVRYRRLQRLAGLPSCPAVETASPAKSSTDHPSSSQDKTYAEHIVHIPVLYLTGNFGIDFTNYYPPLKVELITMKVPEAGIIWQSGGIMQWVFFIVVLDRWMMALARISRGVPSTCYILPLSQQAEYIGPALNVHSHEERLPETFSFRLELGFACIRTCPADLRDSNYAESFLAPGGEFNSNECVVALIKDAVVQVETSSIDGVSISTSDIEIFHVHGLENCLNPSIASVSPLPLHLLLLPTPVPKQNFCPLVLDRNFVPRSHCSACSSSINLDLLFCEWPNEVSPIISSATPPLASAAGTSRPYQTSSLRSAGSAASHLYDDIHADSLYVVCIASVESFAVEVPKSCEDVVIDFTKVKIKVTSIIFPIVWMMTEASFIDFFTPASSILARFHKPPLELKRDIFLSASHHIRVDLSPLSCFIIESFSCTVTGDTDRTTICAVNTAFHIKNVMSPLAPTSPPLIFLQRFDFSIGSYSLGDAKEPFGESSPTPANCRPFPPRLRNIPTAVELLTWRCKPGRTLSMSIIGLDLALCPDLHVMYSISTTMVRTINLLTSHLSPPPRLRCLLDRYPRFGVLRALNRLEQEPAEIILNASSISIAFLRRSVPHGRSRSVPCHRSSGLLASNAATPSPVHESVSPVHRSGRPTHQASPSDQNHFPSANPSSSSPHPPGFRLFPSAPAYRVASGTLLPETVRALGFRCDPHRSNWLGGPSYISNYCRWLVKAYSTGRLPWGLREASSTSSRSPVEHSAQLHYSGRKSNLMAADTEMKFSNRHDSELAAAHLTSISSLEFWSVFTRPVIRVDIGLLSLSLTVTPSNLPSNLPIHVDVLVERLYSRMFDSVSSNRYSDFIHIDSKNNNSQPVSAIYQHPQVFNNHPFACPNSSLPFHSDRSIFSNKALKQKTTVLLSIPAVSISLKGSHDKRMIPANHPLVTEQSNLLDELGDHLGQLPHFAIDPAEMPQFYNEDPLLSRYNSNNNNNNNVYSNKNGSSFHFAKELGYKGHKLNREDGGVQVVPFAQSVFWKVYLDFPLPAVLPPQITNFLIAAGIPDCALMSRRQQQVNLDYGSPSSSNQLPSYKTLQGLRLDVYDSLPSVIDQLAGILEPLISLAEKSLNSPLAESNANSKISSEDNHYLLSELALLFGVAQNVTKTEDSTLSLSPPLHVSQLESFLDFHRRVSHLTLPLPRLTLHSVLLEMKVGLQMSIHLRKIPLYTLDIPVVDVSVLAKSILDSNNSQDQHDGVSGLIDSSKISSTQKDNTLVAGSGSQEWERDMKQVDTFQVNSNRNPAMMLFSSQHPVLPTERYETFDKSSFDRSRSYFPRLPARSSSNLLPHAKKLLQHRHLALESSSNDPHSAHSSPSQLLFMPLLKFQIFDVPQQFRLAPLLPPPFSPLLDSPLHPPPHASRRLPTLPTYCDIRISLPNGLALRSAHSDNANSDFNFHHAAASSPGAKASAQASSSNASPYPNYSSGDKNFSTVNAPTANHPATSHQNFPISQHRKSAVGLFTASSPLPPQPGASFNYFPRKSPGAQSQEPINEVPPLAYIPFVEAAMRFHNIQPGLQQRSSKILTSTTTPSAQHPQSKAESTNFNKKSKNSFSPDGDLGSKGRTNCELIPVAVCLARLASDLDCAVPQLPPTNTNTKYSTPSQSYFPPFVASLLDLNAQTPALGSDLCWDETATVFFLLRLSGRKHTANPTTSSSDSPVVAPPPPLNLNFDLEHLGSLLTFLLVPPEESTASKQETRQKISSFKKPLNASRHLDSSFTSPLPWHQAAFTGLKIPPHVPTEQQYVHESFRLGGRSRLLNVSSTKNLLPTQLHNKIKTRTLSRLLSFIQSYQTSSEPSVHCSTLSSPLIRIHGSLDVCELSFRLAKHRASIGHIGGLLTPPPSAMIGSTLASMVSNIPPFDATSFLPLSHASSSSSSSFFSERDDDFEKDSSESSEIGHLPSLHLVQAAISPVDFVVKDVRLGFETPPSFVRSHRRLGAALPPTVSKLAHWRLHAQTHHSATPYCFWCGAANHTTSKCEQQSIAHNAIYRLSTVPLPPPPRIPSLWVLPLLSIDSVSLRWDPLGIAGRVSTVRGLYSPATSCILASMISGALVSTRFTVSLLRTSLAALPQNKTIQLLVNEKVFPKLNDFVLRLSDPNFVSTSATPLSSAATPVLETPAQYNLSVLSLTANLQVVDVQFASMYVSAPLSAVSPKSQILQRRLKRRLIPIASPTILSPVHDWGLLAHKGRSVDDSTTLMQDGLKSRIPTLPVAPAPPPLPTGHDVAPLLMSTAEWAFSALFASESRNLTFLQSPQNQVSKRTDKNSKEERRATSELRSPLLPNMKLLGHGVACHNIPSQLPHPALAWGLRTPVCLPPPFAPAFCLIRGVFILASLPISSLSIRAEVHDTSTRDWFEKPPFIRIPLAIKAGIFGEGGAKANLEGGALLDGLSVYLGAIESCSHYLLDEKDLMRHKDPLVRLPFEEIRPTANPAAPTASPSYRCDVKFLKHFYGRIPPPPSPDPGRISLPFFDWDSTSTFRSTSQESLPVRKSSEQTNNFPYILQLPEPSKPRGVSLAFATACLPVRSIRLSSPAAYSASLLSPHLISRTGTSSAEIELLPPPSSVLLASVESHAKFAAPLGNGEASIGLSKFFLTCPSSCVGLVVQLVNHNFMHASCILNPILSNIQPTTDAINKLKLLLSPVLSEPAIPSFSSIDGASRTCANILRDSESLLAKQKANQVTQRSAMLAAYAVRIASAVSTASFSEVSKSAALSAQQNSSLMALVALERYFGSDLLESVGMVRLSRLLDPQKASGAVIAGSISQRFNVSLPSTNSASDIFEAPDDEGSASLDAFKWRSLFGFGGDDNNDETNPKLEGADEEDEEYLDGDNLNRDNNMFSVDDFSDEEGSIERPNRFHPSSLKKENNSRSIYASKNRPSASQKAAPPKTDSMSVLQIFSKHLRLNSKSTREILKRWLVAKINLCDAAFKDYEEKKNIDNVNRHNKNSINTFKQSSTAASPDSLIVNNRLSPTENDVLEETEESPRLPVVENELNSYYSTGLLAIIPIKKATFAVTLGQVSICLTDPTSSSVIVKLIFKAIISGVIDIQKAEVVSDASVTELWIQSRSNSSSKTAQLESLLKCDMSDDLSNDPTSNARGGGSFSTAAAVRFKGKLVAGLGLNWIFVERLMVRLSPIQITFDVMRRLVWLFLFNSEMKANLRGKRFVPPLADAYHMNILNENPDVDDNSKKKANLQKRLNDELQHNLNLSASFTSSFSNLLLFRDIHINPVVAFLNSRPFRIPKFRTECELLTDISTVSRLYLSWASLLRAGMGLLVGPSSRDSLKHREEEERRLKILMGSILTSSTNSKGSSVKMIGGEGGFKDIDQQAKVKKHSMAKAETLFFGKYKPKN